MVSNPLVQMARRGWLGPMLEMGLLGSGFYRVAFRGAGLRSGILRELDARPATAVELAERLGHRAELIEGLESWLDAGVSFGELRCDDGRYAIKRRSLKKLLHESNDPVAAFTEEMATLQHRLLVETPERLLSGELFEIGDEGSATIARSSRLGEPWITAALEQFVPATGAVRLLEVGCGSGAHMRTAARINQRLTGVGVELQEPAAEQARANIASWGLADRIEVTCGDIRDRAPVPEFDLVTLHQNIYYFDESDQTALFEHLLGFLRPGGTLLVTTVVRNAGISSATLDLWGAMTRGTSRLPVPDELVTGMTAAGVRDARAVPLGREGMYCAFVGMR